MVAMQALAEYARVSRIVRGSTGIKINVRFGCEKGPHPLSVTEDNRFKMQPVPVPFIPQDIIIDAVGKACAMTQVSVFVCEKSMTIRTWKCDVKSQLNCYQINYLTLDYNETDHIYHVHVLSMCEPNREFLTWYQYVTYTYSILSIANRRPHHIFSDIFYLFEKFGI